jgi:hypothetical protein
MIGMVSKVNRVLRDTLGSPLYYGIITGCVCVLIDLDHPIALALGIQNARFLHPLYLSIACGIIICCTTLLGGLLLQGVLRRRYV